MSDRLDGTYTKMLRAILGVSWKERKTNKELYGNLTKITDTHCWRRKNELINKILTWVPKHGKRKRGRPAINYLDQIRNDTGMSIEELQNTMDDRDKWRKLVADVRARSK